MNIIIGCEEGGKVRDAFIRRGHRAISCDMLSSRRPGPHFQGRLEDFIHTEKWDMGIFFPPCTYLCSSGLHWNKRRPERAALTEDALKFVCMILNSGIPEIRLENPVGCISTRIAIRENRFFTVQPLNSDDMYTRIEPAQYIQPNEFGEDASKKTCIFSVGNYIPLKETKRIPPRIVQDGPYKGAKRWANQTDSGQNREAPSDKRGMIRSETYDGIAEAMAEQWGGEQVKTTLF